MRETKIIKLENETKIYFTRHHKTHHNFTISFGENFDSSTMQPYENTSFLNKEDILELAKFLLNSI